MTLEDFHPFVRHARKLGIERGIYSDFVIPYDCRLFYFAHSSGYVRFADEKYDVKNGDLLIWNSGVKYSMEPTGDSRCLEILALSFDLTNDRSDLSIPISPDGEDCYEPQKRIFCDDVIDVLPFSDSPLFFREAYFAENMLSEMIYEYDNSRRFSSAVLSAKLSELFVCLARSSENRSGDISGVIDYIRTHSSERLTNAMLGKRFGFHPNSLNRLFVLHTGKSLHSYILDDKIRRAIGLLESTDMQISEIGERVGFDDSSYFTRLFGAKVGCTPSMYRSGLNNTKHK